MATTINQVFLCGRVGQDPTLRTVGEKNKVAEFSLATGGGKYTSRGQEIEVPTQWHHIVLWDKQAEIAERFIKKGMMVTIQGQIQYQRYKKEDGTERYLTNIVASSFVFPNEKEGEQSAVPQEPEPAKPQEQPAPQADSSSDPDLPF